MQNFQNLFNCRTVELGLCICQSPCQSISQYLSVSRSISQYLAVSFSLSQSRSMFDSTCTCQYPPTNSITNHRFCLERARPALKAQGIKASVEYRVTHAAFTLLFTAAATHQTTFMPLRPAATVHEQGHDTMCCRYYPCILKRLHKRVVQHSRCGAVVAALNKECYVAHLLHCHRQQLQKGRLSSALAAVGCMTLPSAHRQRRCGRQELMQPARRGYPTANRLSSLCCQSFPCLPAAGAGLPAGLSS